MATNKKSFVLYSDIIHTVKKLTDEKAGVLFKHILSYVNDENPKTDDLIIELVFEPIKQQLKRDLKKWEFISEKRKEAGRKGGIKSGESRNQNEANEANASIAKQNEANEAVNVNDNVNVINSLIPINPHKDGKIEFYPFEEFWNDYGKKKDSKKCKIKWSKIPDSTRIKIKEYLPLYIQTTPDIQFRKDPSTFLNNECWNDPIDIEEHKKNNSKHKIFETPETW